VEHGTVKWVHAKSGMTGIALDDGSHVLIEPIGASGPPVGARLTGDMRSFGEVALRCSESDKTWAGFVLAYDLSEDAIALAMR